MNLRNALVSVSALTFLSRITGFIRDWLIAQVFGAGATTDAFFVAFRLPNLLRRLFAEGAFSQAFVPMLVGEKNRAPDTYRHFINASATTLFIIVAIVTVLGMIFAPQLVALTAPGFVDRPEKFALTVFLTRWCFPYIVLVSLLSLISSVLQTEKQFTMPALAPVFLNLGMIGAVLFTLSWWANPVHALAYGALIGGLMQLALPFWAAHRKGLAPSPVRDFLSAPVIKMMRQMIPATLGVASGQINLLLNTVFASFLISGSVSWLYYADRMMELPVGLLGAALATIILPSLSQAVIDKNPTRINHLVDWGMRLAYLLTLPTSLAFVLIGAPIFLTLFNFGAFTSHDALQSGAALAMYGVGLFPLIAQKVLAPVFFAQKNLKTPALIGVLALIINQGQNLMWVPLFGHRGLALSISLTALMQCAVLYALLWRKKTIVPTRAMGQFLLKGLMALVGFVAVVIWLNPSWSWWMAAPEQERIIRLTLILLGSFGGYTLIWWALGLRPKHFSING